MSDKAVFKFSWEDMEMEEEEQAPMCRACKARPAASGRKRCGNCLAEAEGYDSADEPHGQSDGGPSEEIRDEKCHRCKARPGAGGRKTCEPCNDKVKNGNVALKQRVVLHGAGIYNPQCGLGCPT